MVCFGLEPGAAGWRTQTNPQSYGGTPYYLKLLLIAFNKIRKENFKQKEASVDVHQTHEQALSSQHLQ